MLHISKTVLLNIFHPIKKQQLYINKINYADAVKTNLIDKACEARAKEGTNKMPPINRKRAIDEEENDEEAFLCFLGGGGLKFYPKNGQSNVRFDLEGALIYTFSDFLDGISINGNPLDNDWYFHVELNVIYNFTKNNAALCPKF